MAPCVTILQISMMSSRKGFFSLAARVGLVVMPSMTPESAPWRISSRFAVSRKNFIFSPLDCFDVLQGLKPLVRIQADIAAKTATYKTFVRLGSAYSAEETTG